MRGYDILETYLTPEERELFDLRVRNINGDDQTYLSKQYSSTFGLIGGQFNWSDTPEGDDYWRAISGRVINTDRMSPYKTLKLHSLE